MGITKQLGIVIRYWTGDGMKRGKRTWCKAGERLDMIYFLLRRLPVTGRNGESN
jgi:phenylacetate-coenzyme A ligase PaaK-like adenylate-forming protein